MKIPGEDDSVTHQADYGPNGAEVEAAVDAWRRMSDDDLRRLADAFKAHKEKFGEMLGRARLDMFREEHAQGLGSAGGAARLKALRPILVDPATTYDARDAFEDAASALVMRRHLSSGDFKLLTGPWLAVTAPVRPNLQADE